MLAHGGSHGKDKHATPALQRSFSKNPTGVESPAVHGLRFGF